AHVVAGEDLFDRDARLRGPLPVAGRDLRGDVDALRALAHNPTDHALAAPVAVGERGVDEVDAEVDGAVERLDRLVVVGASPLRAADAPGAVADLRDLESGCSKRAMLHGLRLPR